MAEYRRTIVHWYPMVVYLFALFLFTLGRKYLDVLSLLGLLLISWSLGRGYGSSLGILRIKGDDKALYVRYGIGRSEAIEYSNIESICIVKCPREYGWVGTGKAVRYPAFRMDAVELVLRGGNPGGTVYRVPTNDPAGLYHYLRARANHEGANCNVLTP